MDERERQEEGFDLEEILKEFSENGAGDDSEISPEEDVLIWDGLFPEKPSEESWPTGDTVRLGDVAEIIRQQENPEMEQTIAFTPVGQEEPEPANQDMAQTIAFTPVGQEEEPEEIYQTMPEEPEVEPYSQEWEPEYEQPIGEYVPPEPIVFRPKSRLHELKRKLIAGPEKRYYELTEQGLGKLQAAILFNLLVAIFAAGTTVLFSLGVLGENRTKFVIFSQFISLLLSALLGSYQLMEGVEDIFKKRFSLNSLLVFSLIACLVDGVLCLRQLRIPCCAVFSLNMTTSLWSAYQKRNTELGQMDTMRRAIILDSLVSQPDYYEGRPGFLRGEGQVEDFMDHYNDSSKPEKVLSGYALGVLIASSVIGVVAGVFYGVPLGIQAFAAALLIAVPATAFVAISRPMALLERRLHKLGTVLCGWQGVMGLRADGMFPVRDEDLFPAGAVKMNGVKFYGQREPDEVIAYASALMGACGGSLAPLFTQLLDSRNGHYYEVDGLRGYPNGIGAGVNGEPVLAGTSEFMQDMGVDMPEGTRVKQAIYVAIDGQLCGVFAISYGKTKSASRGLGTLCNYRDLSPVLIGGDFMLTESFLEGKFGVNTRPIVFLDRKSRQDLLEKTPQEQDRALAMMTQEGLASSAFAVTGARAVYKAAVTGVTVHMLAGILGLAIMLVLALTGAEYLLTPLNVLLYELIWMIPGLLITELTRSV